MKSSFPSWVNRYPALRRELEYSVDLLRNKYNLFPPRDGTLRQDTEEMIKLTQHLQRKLQRVLRENPILMPMDLSTTQSRKEAQKAIEELRSITHHGDPNHGEKLAQTYKTGRSLYLMQFALLGMLNELSALDDITRPVKNRPSRHLECYVVDNIRRIASRCGIDKRDIKKIVDLVFAQADMCPPSEATYYRWRKENREKNDQKGVVA